MWPYSCAVKIEARGGGWTNGGGGGGGYIKAWEEFIEMESSCEFLKVTEDFRDNSRSLSNSRQEKYLCFHTGEISGMGRWWWSLHVKDYPLFWMTAQGKHTTFEIIFRTRQQLTMDAYMVCNSNCTSDSGYLQWWSIARPMQKQHGAHLLWCTRMK